jgi:DNA-binding phage protein
MMTLLEIKQNLRDKNLAYVAREIGMTRQQLWCIATGVNGNPTYNTLEKISDYLEGAEDDQLA